MIGLAGKHYAVPISRPDDQSVARRVQPRQIGLHDGNWLTDDADDKDQAAGFSDTDGGKTAITSCGGNGVFDDLQGGIRLRGIDRSHAAARRTVAHSADEDADALIERSR